MTKTTLGKLRSNPCFKTIDERKDLTRYVASQEIQPTITLNDENYVTENNIKYIDIIQNHILQTEEVEFLDKNKNTMLHITLDGDSTSKVTLTFKSIE